MLFCDYALWLQNDDWTLQAQFKIQLLLLIVLLHFGLWKKKEKT